MAIPSPTSFDYHAPRMNARSILVIQLSREIPSESIEECLFKAFLYVQNCYTFTCLQILYHDNGTTEYVPGQKRIERIEIHTPAISFPHSFANLKNSGAPIHFFEDSVAPAPKVPVGKGPHPIFDLKATRIDGGLILCFAFAHNAIDGAAMSLIMKFFAEGCKRAFTGSQEEPSDEEDFQFQRNQTAQDHSLIRDRLRSLQPPNQWKVPPPEFALKLKESGTTSEPLPGVCNIFKIVAPKLKALKLAASPPAPDWISTNDAFSALIMRCVARARLISPTSTINAHITVNARSKFDPPIAEDFMGNCVLNVMAPLPVSELLRDEEESLAGIALRLRQAVASLVPTSVSAIGRWMNAQADPRTVDYDYSYFGRKQDYGIISWAGWGLYHADFGFGFPVFSRQCVTAMSDSCRIFPQMRDGSLEVLMGLEAEDMKRLRADSVWRKWTEEVAVQ